MYIAGLIDTKLEEVEKGIKENTFNLTPVEQYGNIFIKREDTYKIFDVCGSKSRQAYNIISNTPNDTFVTCGARKSPQIQIVANICKHLGKKCYCFTNRGELTSELKLAQEDGANIIQNDNWLWMNVIDSHAREFAKENNYHYIEFGMETWDNVIQVAKQVENIPNNDIIVPVGSGINLCGILWGLKVFNKPNRVIGVQVGKDVQATLKKYAPYTNNLEIVKSTLDYSQEAKDNILCGIELDKIYEAKALPYLKENNLFWIIGKRRGV